MCPLLALYALEYADSAHFAKMYQFDYYFHDVKMREFFTSQEKCDFMLLLAISIFVVVIISVITVLNFF